MNRFDSVDFYGGYLGRYLNNILSFAEMRQNMLENEKVVKRGSNINSFFFVQHSGHGLSTLSFSNKILLALRLSETHPENSRLRKRRDVEIEVTTETDADEDRGDFHEFQLLHHHSRFRRSAAEPQQCGPLKCDGESTVKVFFFN